MRYNRFVSSCFCDFILLLLFVAIGTQIDLSIIRLIGVVTICKLGGRETDFLRDNEVIVKINNMSISIIPPNECIDTCYLVHINLEIKLNNTYYCNQDQPCDYTLHTSDRPYKLLTSPLFLDSTGLMKIDISYKPTDPNYEIVYEKLLVQITYSESFPWYSCKYTMRPVYFMNPARMIWK